MMKYMKRLLRSIKFACYALLAIAAFAAVIAGPMMAWMRVFPNNDGNAIALSILTTTAIMGCVIGWLDYIED